MSKLAALAAKRRQKENSRPAEAEERGATATDEYVSSLKALRLSSAAPVKRKISDVQTGVDTAAVEKPADLDANPAKQSKIGPFDSSKTQPEFQPEDVIAQPSAFAKTMFGTAPQVRPFNLVLPIQQPSQGSHFQPFDFTTPSPDDLVTRAQAAKGPR
jgi:hypothetical protein